MRWLFMRIVTLKCYFSVWIGFVWGVFIGMFFEHDYFLVWKGIMRIFSDL